MLTQKKIDKLMFFSIETVASFKSFNGMSSKLQLLFKEKFKKEVEEIRLITVVPEGMTRNAVMTIDVNMTLQEYQLYLLNQLYIEKAPLFPEFSKVAAISWGGFIGEDGKFKINSVLGDEIYILTAFSESLNKIPYPYTFSLCSFFCKNFSLPFISKRMLVNGIKMPKIIDVEGLKAWERGHVLDLHEEWAMGVYGSYTSLNTLWAMFNIDYETLKPEEIHAIIYGTGKETLKDRSEEKTIGIASLYLAMSLSKVKISIN